MTTRASRRAPAPAGWGLPIGLGVGASVGTVVGLLLGQLAIGMSLGAALGLVVGTVATTARDVPAPRRRLVVGTAIGILVAGLAAAAIVLLGETSGASR